MPYHMLDTDLEQLRLAANSYLYDERISLLRQTILDLLSNFPLRRKRWAKVIVLAFGLDGKGSRTYEQIGKELGCSRKRIYQIRCSALRMLRRPDRARELREFV